MALHLFSTPTQCPRCGTVVEDPTVDKCPKCGWLLRERRTPSRLAGVEERYGNVRFLAGFLRFLGVVTVLVGVLILSFGTGGGDMSWAAALGLGVGALALAVAMFSVAAFFNVVMDLEENTRSSFRIQQRILERFEPEAEEADSEEDEDVPPPSAA